MKKNNLKTLIITCWAVLVLCFIIKIFGGNWFELGAENIKFIQFCNFVDNNMWLKMLLSCILSCLSNYFIICIIINKKKLKLIETIFFMILIIIRSILSWYYSIVAFILDIVILIGCTTFINKKILRSLICFGIIILFQAISLVIRNIGFANFNDNSFLIQVLLQIDYYIMIFLLYLYNIKQIKKKGE